MRKLSEGEEEEEKYEKNKYEDKNKYEEEKEYDRRRKSMTSMRGGRTSLTSISMRRRKSMTSTYEEEGEKEYEKDEKEEKEYEKDEEEGDPRDWKYCTHASQIVLPAVGFGVFPWSDFCKLTMA